MILDRYLLRQFVLALMFSLVALSVLFVIIDLFDSLDKFLDNHVGMDVILKYYALFLPGVIKLIAPVATLLAALFSVGKLSASFEIVSINVGGRSLYRIVLPFVLFAIVLSSAQLYFNGWIAPTAAWELAQIKRGSMGQSDGSGSMYNMYFRDNPLQNVSIEYFDEQQNSARTVIVEQFNSTGSPRIVAKYDCPIMTWSDSLQSWQAPLCTIWTFTADSIKMNRVTNQAIPFSIHPEHIANLQRNPEELTLDELQTYIQTIKLGGKNSRKLEIAYFGEWAFAFAHLIVILVAVPFASVKRRGGMAVNIAAAMIVAFGYIAFNTISMAQGLTMDIDPRIVAWSSNGLFILVSLLILFRTKT